MKRIIIFAALLLVFGTLADRFGRRRMLLLGGAVLFLTIALVGLFLLQHGLKFLRKRLDLVDGEFELFVFALSGGITGQCREMFFSVRIGITASGASIATPQP